MQASTTNLRKLPRKSVNQDISVVNVTTETAIGKVANLHEEGFMLFGAVGLKENGVYQLRWDLQIPVGEKSSIAVGAECLWLRDTGVGNQLWAGFQIIDIADEDKKLIPGLVEQIQA